MVKIEGLRDLEAALKELPQAAAKQTVRKILIAAGTPIQEDAQARAPTRKNYERKITFGPKGAKRVRKPGTSKALVQIGTRLTKNQAREARRAGKSTTEVYVGTRDRAARLEEHGTSTAPPTPFMRPAWDAHKANAREVITDQLGDAITAKANALAKKAAR